jgi:uncharacterized SAM-binding protein YcdF (DUF218 family)
MLTLSFNIGGYLMDLFALKKIIGLLLMPMSLISMLLVIAILYFKAKPRLSFKCLVSASLLLFISSLGVVADQLILPLEKDFTSYRPTEPFNDMTVDSADKNHHQNLVDYIIVLGCGHTSNNDLPITAQLYTCSLQRLVETVRIANIHPKAQIITSGASFDDPVAHALKMQQAAMLLGIPEERILTEVFAKDTEEEAQLIAPRVRGKKVILITNANHMHRSINYFKSQNVEVIPAPASFYVKQLSAKKKWSYYLLPQARNLLITRTACYEYLGLTVQWLKTLW